MQTTISQRLVSQRAAESPENGPGARARRLRRLRRARTSRLPTVRHVQSGSSTIRQASGRARDAPETSDRCPRSPATSYGSRSSAIVMPKAKALRGWPPRRGGRRRRQSARAVHASAHMHRMRFDRCGHGSHIAGNHKVKIYAHCMNYIFEQTPFNSLWDRIEGKFVCPCLSLSVLVCPCLSLSVPS